MLKKNWSVRSEILKRVQREAECEVVIDYMPPVPEYKKVKWNWSKTSLKAFASGIIKVIAP
jgi:hypothetical protein